MGLAVEQAGDPDLELIPREVRDKLDRVGIKLHLREWRLLPLLSRRDLCEWQCSSEEEIATYRTHLVDLVMAATGRPPDQLA